MKIGVKGKNEFIMLNRNGIMTERVIKEGKIYGKKKKTVIFNIDEYYAFSNGRFRENVCL
jgi:hypothetical protein